MWRRHEGLKKGQTIAKSGEIIKFKNIWPKTNYRSLYGIYDFKRNYFK